jgi:hypothetical protein
MNGMRGKMKIQKTLPSGKVVTFNVSDLRGEVFGRLTAIEIVGSNSGAIWLCKCDCGKFSTPSANSLISGTTKSCGSHRIEAVVKANLKHGLSKTPEYAAWRSMVGRCYNPKNDSYEVYQKRGIKICAGWLNSFETFLDDMGERPKKGFSLDRIDNDSWYSCGHCEECISKRLKMNCRWADSKTQTRNTSYNNFIEINGERKCVTEWCEIYKTTKNRVYSRVRKKGMSLKDAILMPPKRKKHEHTP